MTRFRNVFIKYKTQSKSVYPLSSVFVLTDGHGGRFNGRFAGMLMHKTGVRGYVIVMVVGRRACSRHTV
jgi:serine/threonine protein phosphatase PrpC